VKCELRNIRILEYMMDSKTEFANMLGVDVHTYTKWENGGNPTLINALEVAEKLNKKVEDIWCLR
jgi:putative transcriptional regulator